MADKNHKLEWLDEIEMLADVVLSQQETSACEQVHPIVERWYKQTLQGEPPSARDSIMQAMVCLVTEIMADMPDEIFDVLSANFEEEEVALWLQEILLIGRAFEHSLQHGEFDDL